MRQFLPKSSGFRDDPAAFVHDVSHVAILGGSRATALIWIMCGDPISARTPTSPRRDRRRVLPAVHQPPPRRALPIRRDDLAGPHATIAAGSSPSCPIAWCAIPGKSMTSAVGSGPTGLAPISLRVARRGYQKNSPEGGWGCKVLGASCRARGKTRRLTSSDLTQFILRHIAASQMLPRRKIGKQASQKIRLSI